MTNTIAGQWKTSSVTTHWLLTPIMLKSAYLALTTKIVINYLTQ